MKKRFKFALITTIVYLVILVSSDFAIPRLGEDYEGLGYIALLYSIPLLFIINIFKITYDLHTREYFFYWYFFGSVFYFFIGFIIGFIRELAVRNKKS